MKRGVVGLGLIGGSIFKTLKALNNHKYEIVGVSSSVKLKNVSKDYEILKTADIVFVCTPMNVTLKVLDTLEKYLSPSTIVADTCSLKTFVSQKKYKFKFVPTHPMAGTEKSGWENSFNGLFKNAKWVITPLDGILSSEVEAIEAIIKDMCAEVVFTTPEEHDEAVGLISHAPLLIAQAMCESIKDNKLAQILASSGFRDTTRLALSNSELANDMVNLNKQNIIKAFNKYKDCVENLLNSNVYYQEAKRIKNFRDNL